MACGTCGDNTKNLQESSMKKQEMLALASKIVDLFPEEANMQDARQVMQLVVTLMPPAPATVVPKP